MRLRKVCSAIAALGLLTACSGVGSAGTGSNSAAALQQANQVNIDNIKASVANAQTALQTAQSALGSIFNSDGSFNWDIFLGGVNFSTLGANTQTCLQNAFPTSNIAELILTSPEDIATALACVLNDVVSVAGIANTDLNTALATLDAALAAAGSNTAEVAEIQAMITEVQTAQTSYTTMMTALASQLTVVTSFLNTLPTLASSAVPVPILNLFVGMTVSAFVQPIVDEILNFQQQMEAL